MSARTPSIFSPYCRTVSSSVFTTLAFVICLFLSETVISAAQASEPDQSLRYTFSGYAGGLHVATVTLDYVRDAERYHTRMDLQTEGMLAWFLDGKLSAAAKGELSIDAATPFRYRTVDVFNDDRNELELDYGRDPPRSESPGLPVRTDPDGERDRKAGVPEKIKPEDRVGTTDPITALAVLNGLALDPMGERRASSDEPPACGGRSQIYDGKRRYDLELASATRKTLSKSRFNLHQGAAWNCAFVLRRVGGFRKKDEVYDDHLQSGSVWFARPRPDLPISIVRIDTDSALDAVRIHLQAVETGTREITLPE